MRNKNKSSSSLCASFPCWNVIEKPSKENTKFAYSIFRLKKFLLSGSMRREIFPKTLNILMYLFLGYHPLSIFNKGLIIDIKYLDNPLR